ncbi:MAG: porin family protein [Alphaproteobacteria bacterium]|nr:porin family protein [Alphaproteobacteria bacterium]
MGVNAGGATSNNCWNLKKFTNPYAGLNADGSSDPVGAEKLTGNEGCNTATGSTFGGQAGYRWQAANWVFGVEAQGNWASISGSNVSEILNTDNFGFPTYKKEHHNRASIDSFAMLTGQLGYAFGSTLLYVKGGAAVVSRTLEENRVTHNLTFSEGTLAGYAADTSWGGTVGAGLEVGVAPNWSLGAEYNRIFLGNRTVDLTNTAGGGALYKTDGIRQNVDMATVRLNYKLGGPVMAKQ